MVTGRFRVIRGGVVILRALMRVDKRRFGMRFGTGSSNAWVTMCANLMKLLMRIPLYDKTSLANTNQTI